ncbi:hypothetical protein M406DRAFT_69299 [Cryphonectria parasitica EP155]|uniref:Rhodopsin domain-containing protein n=1 Tax=Cryphonectria parasitica (strain ATCC 38755 / EP155) TaxID=660469 RepID=A0A9P5CRC5_CRYP1|nr:uncharacterized protein M406DRAFT_69299 [Cryphonectria parasitica EP155]KAF3767136.1 hypothetical protein M406DRAFT_69299 [Cryphonectria parasitica EP155]
MSHPSRPRVARFYRHLVAERWDAASIQIRCDHGVQRIQGHHDADNRIGRTSPPSARATSGAHLRDDRLMGRLCRACYPQIIPALTQAATGLDLGLGRYHGTCWTGEGEKLDDSKNLGLTQWCLVIAQISFSVLCAFTIVSSCYGLGIPAEDLSAANSIGALKYLTLFEACYFVVQCFIKTSIGITVLRTICTTRRQRYVVYGIIASTVLVLLTFFVWLFSACRPVAAHWDRSLGTCSYSGYVVALHLISAIAVFTDATFTFMLVWAIWRTHLPTRNKYMLMGVFSFGALAVLACIVRWALIEYIVYRLSTLFLCKRPFQSWLFVDCRALHSQVRC